jgi:small-conductance mechanosensitive channel
MTDFFASVRSALPLILVVVGFLALLIVSRIILKRIGSGRSEMPFRRQLILIGLFIVGLFVIVVTLPIDAGVRQQLLAVLGILISAVIALSSTSLVANLMAGLMLRTIQNFRPGDFVKVGEHFGRISERGLFRIEMQTIDRDLITIPNLYLAQHPHVVTRSSGTFVTADVTLGYDIPRQKVDELLRAAAEAADLSEPFVQILDLMDHAVMYRVAGFLKEVRYYVTRQSDLRGEILDAFHREGLEVVSPSYAVHRNQDQSEVVIPDSIGIQENLEEEREETESLAFDKADEAESIEKLRERVALLDEEIETSKAQQKNATDKEKIKERIERLDEFRRRILDQIDAKSSTDPE